MIIGVIKIGGMDFKVVEVEDLSDEGVDLDGDISYGKCIIRIDSDLDEQQKFAVIWHEILHGILTFAGHIDNHPEHLVNLLSYGIVQVLRDNPSVRALSQAADSKEKTWKDFPAGAHDSNWLGPGGDVSIGTAPAMSVGYPHNNGQQSSGSDKSK